MFNFLRCFSIVLALSTPTFAFGQQIIRLVADEWAPFGGADLPSGGISLDVMTTALERAGYQVSSEIVPWERALSGMRSGEYDAIGNLFYDAELEAFLTYADPFYQTDIRFLRQVGTTADFTDIESLAPHTIAVGAGYLYEKEFDDASQLQKQEVTTVEQGVRMVANGRVDLTLDSVDVLRYLISEVHPELKSQVEILSVPLATRRVHMAVRNDFALRDTVIADFNHELEKMRADGTLMSLLAKHQY